MHEKRCVHGVSEVLGEMLLLAIVVLISVVFANYASGFIPPIKNVPQAKFVGYVNRSNYTVVLQAGEPVPFAGLSISVVYNYTSCPRYFRFTYNRTTKNIAVFSSKGLNSYLYLRSGWYNKTWSFGERLNIPNENSNFTVVSIVYNGETICRLHFVR